MDNLDDLDNNAKISDSAYSVSCSNSQSRSRSSKSTHSGSSGSSGYGGPPSTSCSNSNPPPAKRSKENDSKIKKPSQTVIPEAVIETECENKSPVAPEQPKLKQTDVNKTAAQKLPSADEEAETSEITQIDAKEEVVSSYLPAGNTSVNSNGFSCVISMHDGVVMYTTSSLTDTLGFPKDMWTGRSFIDFIHVRDRNTFASQITNGLAVPTTVNGTLEKVQSRGGSISTMVCRIRRYRGLMSGFGVRERDVTFMPFLLKLTFKNVNDETGEVIYLVVQATALFSAFKEPNEIVTKPVSFVMRHAANGNLEYIDPESVPYLGYLPQDILGKDMLQLYHEDDLPYLTQVYETIVTKGGLAKSKPYRMMTQNQDSIKLETEWSSFINPWSRKLEFVIGKHHIVEGPTNPDVFQTPDTEKAPKVSEEEKKKLQATRDNIVKIMNKVLTKPAKLAQQQMNKRCQDLASFMESLMEMEEKPKLDGELRVEINDQDRHYEIDSMLGGISPHHDCNDSKSSIETPLSYNQLNYNDTLQRYFQRHQPLSFEDYNNVTEEHKLSLKNTKLRYSSPNLSPLTLNFGDAGDFTSSCESVPVVRVASPVSPLSDQPFKLTETLLSKHNAEMEKEMLRLHRETRTSNKGEREKITTENRQKKKKHLARCNATFQPTNELPVKDKLHGLKRSSKPELDTVAPKHHCPTSRQVHRRHTTSTAEVQPSATLTTSMASSPWHNNPVKNTNAFLLGMGIPPEISIMDAAMPQQMIAMPAIPVHCMMYGQTMYGSPIMYSAIAPQVPYPMQQTLMSQTTRYTNLLYSQINNPQLMRENQSGGNQTQKIEGESVPAPSCSNTKEKVVIRVNEETVDKTDEESSYSSFYSSFFKTESGSAEDSDPKKCNRLNAATVQLRTGRSPSSTTFPYDKTSKQVRKVPRRKLQPAWMEQVCVTSELIYKYQITTKSMEEVLSSDKEKIHELIQPSLVNEQLGQLYLDLQLEGVAARLTLEEGITSSSSSGEETTNIATEDLRRKRDHRKLVMIYEEDAPFPPPEADEVKATLASTT